MKVGTNILLAILGVLLALSIIASLVAYRLENTVLVYSYMSHELKSIVGRLEDPVIRERSAGGTVDYIQDTFALKLPKELYPYAYRAAYTGFGPQWYERTGKRLLFNTLLVVSRESTVLSLPVSIHEFKLALLDIARIEFGVAEYIEIDRKVSRMPSEFELTGRMREDELDRVVRTLRAARPVLLIAAYLVPGVLILLCFAPLRIGSALRAAGAGLLAGSTAVILGALALRGVAVREVAAAVTGALPPFLLWTGPEIEELVGGLVSGMLPAAVAVGVAGAVFLASGIGLVAFKGDRRVKFRRCD